MGVFVFGLLTVCRIPNAIALAVFAGLADVLPYVGVFLSVGPAVLAALPVGPGVRPWSSWWPCSPTRSSRAGSSCRGSTAAPCACPPSIVMVALLAGGTLMGIVGALLALPVAAAVRMLVDELRVELPGEVQDDAKIHARDDRFEREYELRAEGIPAEQAAAIAVEIAEIRRDTEGRPSGECPNTA